MISDYLRKGTESRKDGTYYPSDIGGCMRKLWYSYTKGAEPDMGKLTSIQLGRMMHGFLADVINSEKTDIRMVKPRVAIMEKFEGITVEGDVQAMIISYEGREYVMGVRATKWLDGVRRPDRIHSMQMNLYMHATGVPRAMIAYIEKSTLKTKTFTVKYVPEKAMLALKRFKKLHDCIIRDELPSPEAKQGNEKWQCSYCDYVSECARDAH